MEHHEFSPSKFPQFEKCIHFESGAVGEAAHRGTLQHIALEDLINDVKEKQNYFLKQELPLSFSNLMEDEIENVLFAFRKVQNIIDKYQLTYEDNEVLSECELVAMSSTGTMVYGTGDIVVRLPESVLIIDYKSGRSRDYSGQLKVYALACMQEHNVNMAEMMAVYGTEKKVVNYGKITKDDAQVYFDAIVKDLIEMEKKPVANEYCNWCSKNSNCKVLNKMALAVKSPKEKDLLKGITVATNLKKLTSDKLGKLYKFTSILESWIKAVKDETKTRLVAGDEVNGYELKETSGRRKVVKLDELVTIGHLDPVEILKKCSMALKDFSKLDIKNKENFIVTSKPTMKINEIKTKK